MVVEQREAKPKIEFLDFAYSPNPSKNYSFQLLAADILKFNPQRSLDGGCGELRNRWMFPGHYVGIGLNHASYFRGLKRAVVAAGKIKSRQSNPLPEVYLARLESDLSFIEPVDLTVCTNTLGWIEDKTAALDQMISRTKAGGSLIVEERCGLLEPFVGILSKHFAHLDIIYWGLEGCDFIDTEMSDDEVIALSKLEMAAPNIREGHDRFYLRATGKLSPPTAASERPEMIYDHGVYTLVRELPYLKSDDEPLEVTLRRRGLM